MIVFDLTCENAHRFEGWFASSDDFAEQNAADLIGCPECGSVLIGKAPMAPTVPRKGNATNASTAPVQAERQLSNAPLTPEIAAAITRLAKAQAEALKDSTWVGREFAETSRAMHYGERDHAAIHGEASLTEAKELLEEGVAIAPLPLPVAPPEKLN